MIVTSKAEARNSAYILYTHAQDQYYYEKTDRAIVCLSDASD